MLLLLDTADLQEIKRLCDLFPIDGVTTNPTILNREKQSPMGHLEKIREILPSDAQLHVQLLSESAEKMVIEAHHIVNTIGGNIYVKIPVTAQGIKAIKALSKEGVSVTATVVHAPMQAFFAAKAGASYVAPYVNRIDNMGVDGVQAVKEIQTIFAEQKMDCGVLAASFKNSRQITELCAAGVSAVTAAPDVMEMLIRHPATDKADADFRRDFCQLAGTGKTMLDF
ncbi:MAG: fructose-6-phosphate aldolase [Ruminococcaceae bacterium]|nr:fructose-6-phosphate aldolase [Oscillospiraceae bacterium]